MTNGVRLVAKGVRLKNSIGMQCLDNLSLLERL